MQPIAPPIKDKTWDFFRLAIGQGVKSKSDIWYKNIQVLGVGGNSVTFLAHATSGPFRGVLFALKVFRRISDKPRQERFLTEFDSLMAFQHPSIMQVYDSGLFKATALGQQLEYPFIIAEYLPSSLSDVMRSKRATMAEKVSSALQLLSSLTYLSTQNPAIVHRDIKPQNIFLKGRSCVLGDFGLMKVLDGTDEPDRNTMKASALPGMPYYYRTPDLIAYARGEAPITTKSDVFQLGLVLAELFTGKNPAIPPSDPDNLLEPLRLAKLGHISCAQGPGIATLIKRMLQFDQTQREDASLISSAWQGVFEEVVQRSTELEGRAF